MADLLEEGEVPVEWVWEPFIPRGSLTLLAAYMKVGKSTLMYALVSAIAKGGSFCGYPTTKMPVLILGVEESQREIKNRLIKFGVQKEDPVMVHVGPLMPSAETYSDLSKVIEDNNIGLVVLDTLSQFWGIEDENDNAEALRALAPLQKLARTSGATVLLVHHNGKGEGEGGRSIRGASALFGVVDQALILKTHGDKRSSFRKLESLGRFDETPPEIVLSLNPDTESYELVGTQDDARLLTIRLKIRSFLVENPGAHTAASMMAALDIRKASIFKALATPMPWVHRDGTGKKGNPYTYSIIMAGGVLPDALASAVEKATVAALDLSHLMD